MTELLYMDNIQSNYIKEFDAIVTKNKKDYVCLYETAFYPLGGGQPSDIGFLEWNDKKTQVKEVIKKGVDPKSFVAVYFDKEVEWNEKDEHLLWTISRILNRRYIEILLIPALVLKMGRSGTGLGMTIVWNTVQDHHGYIILDSVKGEGTTFSLYFHLK